MSLAARRWWPVVLLAVVLVEAPVWTGHVPLDLKVYRLGGHAALHGHSLYGAALHVHEYGFTYPPFAALLFVPLAVVPRWLAMTLMTLLSTAALLVTVRLCAPRLFADARRTWSALAPAAAIGLAEPVHATLHDGQVGLLLMGLVVIDVLVLRDTRWAGVLIGVAAAIKLTPAAFVLLLAAQRRWGAVCTAAVTLLVTAGVAAALLPHDSRRFWTKEVFGSGHIGETARLDNQSWNGFWQRLLGHTHTATALWAICAAVTTAAGYWLARRLVVRSETVLALGVVGVTGCLVSPVSWTHHWVWWVPVLLGLAARPGRKRLVVATAAVMVIGASRDAFKPLYRPTVGEVTLGYWYLWAAVVLLVALAVRQLPDPSEHEPPGVTRSGA